MVTYLIENGGTCDCEVLLNVEAGPRAERGEALARPRECGDFGSIRKHCGKTGAGRFHCSPRSWHTRLMNALWLSLLFASPWLAAIAYTWSRAPRMDDPAPSMADRTRDRHWV